MIYIGLVCLIIPFIIISIVVFFDKRNTTNNKMYYVEKVFSRKGYTCVVILNCWGHRCGYVGIPKSHVLYGLDYDELEDYDLMVHGGLTYARDSSTEYPIATQKDIWWFGFDCGHCFDGKDYDAVYKHIPLMRDQIKLSQEIDSKYYIPNTVVRTSHYVANECKLLANQLRKIEAVKAAKDLLYGDEVIKQLEAAKTIAKMDRIMKTARKEKFK